MVATKEKGAHAMVSSCFGYYYYYVLYRSCRA